MMKTGALLLLIAFQGAAQTTPTFHAETRLEQVNVVVHEKNRPVANLTKDDFLLTDRGTPRSIAVFSVATAANLAAPTPAKPLPTNTFSNLLPHVASNGEAHNGVTIILLDGMNTLNYNKDPADLFMDTLRTDSMSLAFARRQVMKFVENVLPGDRVAIYSLGASLQVLCDFTNDSGELQKIVAGYRAKPAVSGDDADATQSYAHTPGSSERNAAGLINVTRAGSTIEALRAIADHVAGIPGRKNLVWLTAAMPFSAETVARIVSRANIAIYPVDARGLATEYSPPFAHPEAFTGKMIRPVVNLASDQGTMTEVAQKTGGQAYLNNNDLSGAIRKAIDDTAVTYTLGFYVDQKSLDGKFHEIKIRVKDPAMEVRYPRGYYAYDRAPPNLNNVDRIVLSPLESAEVHLLARIERTNPPPSLNVSGAIDLNNIELRPQGNLLTGSVELYLVQQDAGGQVLDKNREKLILRLTREEYAAYLKSGLFFRKVVPAKQNAATLRVVAGDPRTAKMGSLIIPISQVR